MTYAKNAVIYTTLGIFFLLSASIQISYAGPWLELTKKFDAYDYDKDGIQEILKIGALYSAKEPEPDKPLVVILVEDRITHTALPILNTVEGAAGSVAQSVVQYANDLEAEGYSARIVRVQLYKGPEDQDGLNLLALRQFLKEVKRLYPKFYALTLVGDFSSAVIARKVLRHKAMNDPDAGLMFVNGAPVSKSLKNFVLNGNPFAVQVSTAQSGDVADIVLSDLDGDWESRYIKKAKMTGLMVILMKNPTSNLNAAYAVRMFGKDIIENKVRVDFFYLDDSPFVLNFYTSGTKMSFRGDPAELLTGLADVTSIGECAKCTLLLKPPANAEVSASDKLNPNPISIPDILVSRINARHVAFSPDLTLVGKDQKKKLILNGVPQTVTFDSANLDVKVKEKQQEKSCLSFAPDTDDFDCLWSPDLSLEQKLLREYFARNHAYRTALTLPASLMRPASISFDLADGGLYENNIKQGNPSWANLSFDEAKTLGLVVEQATTVQLARWLTVPAILRGVKAHSTPLHSTFGGSSSAEAFSTMGKSWKFSATIQGSETIVSPNYSASLTAADFYFYRTLYENKKLENSGPRIYVHEGCESTSLMGNTTVTKGVDADTLFGRRQGAESLLHFTNGLAVVGRSVVSYDWPDGVSNALGIGETLGHGLKAYFLKSSQNASLTNVADDSLVSAKNAYPWVIYGDWSLTIRNR